MNPDILGYVALGADGKPIRPARSGYRNQTHPPRLYTTEGRAAVQSPVGKAVAVIAAPSKPPGAKDWECPIRLPGCLKNCGSYGCGN